MKMKVITSFLMVLLHLTTRGSERKRAWKHSAPFLNIVERVISCLKAGIKADRARPAMQDCFGDRNTARNPQLSLGEYWK